MLATNNTHINYFDNNLNSKNKKVFAPQDALTSIFLATLGKDNNTIIKKPVLGSSGCTFLCSISERNLNDTAASFFKIEKGEISNVAKPLNFVVKLLSHDQAINEWGCARFLKQFGFNTPSISFLENLSVKKEFLEVMKRHHSGFPTESMNELQRDKEIIIMPKFTATTMASFIEERRILLLNDEEIEELAEMIGKIAIFDLIIGNDDRFIRFSVEKPGELLAPNLNWGNLMVEIDLNNHLKNIYLIDNATTSKMVKRHKIDEKIFSDGLAGIFDENSQNQMINDDIQVKIPVNYSEKLKHILPYFLSKLSFLKNHIMEGIEKELIGSNQTCEPNEVDRVNQLLKIFDLNLEKGFKEAIKIAKNKNTIIGDSFGTHTNEFTNNLKSVLQSNISYIENN